MEYYQFFFYKTKEVLLNGQRHAPAAAPGAQRPENCKYSDQPRDSPHLFGGDGSPNVGPKAVPKNAETQSQPAYQVHDAQESAEGDPARPCGGARGPTSA